MQHVPPVTIINHGFTVLVLVKPWSSQIYYGLTTITIGSKTMVIQMVINLPKYMKITLYYNKTMLVFPKGQSTFAQ